MKSKLLLLASLVSFIFTQAQVSNFVSGLDQPNRLIIDNNILYVKGVETPGQVIQIDLNASSPVASVLFNSLPSSADPIGIGNIIKQGDIIYFSYINDNTGESTLASFNINTPTVLTNIASGLGFVAALDIYNDEVYFTDEDLSGGGTTVKKVDVTVSNPTIDIVISGLTNPQDMEFNGSVLYIGDKDAGGTGVIYSVDVSLMTPILNTFISDVNARGVYVYDDFLYFSDAGVIKKASFLDPSNVTTVAMDTGDTTDFLRDVVISNNRLYMPQENFGKIVSKEDPASLVTVVDPIDSGSTGFELDGNDLYYASSNGEISKIDISSASPSITNVLSGLNEPEGLLLNGNELYFSQAGSNKISKIDITATIPVITDVVTGLSEPGYLALNGNELYISELGAGKISKIDITSSLPTSATDVIIGLSLPLDLEFNGNDLYFTQVDANKVSRININNPSSTLIDVVTGLSKPLQLELVGNDLFITENDANKISKIDVTTSFPANAIDVLTGINSGGIIADANNLFFDKRSSTSVGLGEISKIDVSSLTLSSFESVVADNHNKYYIYPNPAVDYILVSGADNNGNYRIYNVLGMTILNESFSNTNKIDVSDLPKGMYILNYNDSNTFKFIKK